MEVTFTEHVTVKDTTSVGEARRMAQLLAQRLGFDDTRSGEFALLATEVSRNVLVHGGGGQVVVTGHLENDEAVGRILAMDKGPGIANVAKAMSDGFSTAGTMGGGMGAMKRIASHFDIFTGRTGTIVLLQVGSTKVDERLQVAGIAVPYPGERVCGDAWICHRSADRTIVLVVDGLGHGWEAAEAAKEAVATFHRRLDMRPGEILGFVHDALRKTRGAVAAIAEVRPSKNSLVYAGVGNIAAVVLHRGGSRSLVSHNGTLGVATSRIQEFQSEWPADGVLVLHSDGLTSKWDLSSYAGLLVRHPAMIGATLLRDFRRHRDDASVVVIKAA